jgi:hypothetical protein
VDPLRRPGPIKSGSEQAMKRQGSEKPCEKISPIAGTTCHPQSTSGVLPTTAKPDAHLSVNNFQS